MTVSPSEISVVVQGPVDRALTPRCLASVRKHLPRAQIILSTWRGSDVSGLGYDELVENDDPGQPEYLKLASSKSVNVNRMIVSSKAGIEAASRSFVLRLRSDMILTGRGFLRHACRYPAQRPTSQVFQRRVIVPTVFSVNPWRGNGLIFHLSDWAHFGTRHDSQLLWSPSLISDAPHTDAPTPDLREFGNEQYIWMEALNRHGWVSVPRPSECRASVVRAINRTIAANVVLLQMRQFGIWCPKYPMRFTGGLNLYTHREWLQLYRQECKGEPGGATDPFALAKQVYLLVNGATRGRMTTVLSRAARTLRRVGVSV